MKAKLYITTLLIALCLAPPIAFAQQEEPPLQQLAYSHSVPHSSPTTISQDRSGSIYILDAARNLLRLDALGRPLDTFSPPTRGRISHIEAWNPMKILLFYEDRQEVLLLDRFLRPISSTALRDLQYEGIARAATLSADDGFWLFDETTLTLAKLDLRLRQKIIETPLNLILDKARFDVRQIREYQNMVYMLDYNSGIYVFDSLGNYKRSIPFKELAYIGFRGNEVYFVQDGKLNFYDLYTQQQRSLELPAGKAYITALAGDKELYLFTKEEVDIYTWQ